MHACKFCKKKFEKIRVFNQHLSISHKSEWNKTLKDWWNMNKSGISARKIAEKYNVNILTVYKYLKKMKKEKGEW